MAQIKPLNADELEVIVHLANRIWPSSYANILTPEQINNMLDRIYNVQSLRDELQSGHRFFSAELDGRAVGYASAYQEAEVLWLKKLYVLPEMQGQGVGKKLINAIVNTFPPSQEIRLLVNRDNLPAQQFYLRQGFSRTGEIPVRMGDFAFVDLVFSRPL